MELGPQQSNFTLVIRITIFGIESYMQGINNLKKYIKLNKIENICVFHGDAIEIVSEILPDDPLMKY